MKEAAGNIWDWRLSPHNCEIVVPTDLGWRSDGSSTFGSGMAKQAVKLYGKDVASWYGEICQSCGPHTPVAVHPEHPLIFFPVKPLNYDEPHLSWRNDACIGIVEQSMAQLALIRTGPMAIPMVGCGPNGLREKKVREIIRYYFRDSGHVTLVVPPGSHNEE